MHIRFADKLAEDILHRGRRNLKEGDVAGEESEAWFKQNDGLIIHIDCEDTNEDVLKKVFPSCTIVDPDIAGRTGINDKGDLMEIRLDRSLPGQFIKKSWLEQKYILDREDSVDG